MEVCMFYFYKFFYCESTSSLLPKFVMKGENPFLKTVFGQQKYGINDPKV